MVEKEPNTIEVPFRYIEEMLFQAMPGQHTGTYNRADPTAYKKAEGYVVLEDTHCGAKIFRVKYSDVTWITTITAEEIIFSNHRRRCTRPRIDVQIDPFTSSAKWYVGGDNKLLLLEFISGKWFKELRQALRWVFSGECGYSADEEYVFRHSEFGDLAPIYQSSLGHNRWSGTERRLP